MKPFFFSCSTSLETTTGLQSSRGHWLHQWWHGVFVFTLVGGTDISPWELNYTAVHQVRWIPWEYRNHVFAVHYYMNSRYWVFHLGYLCPSWSIGHQWESSNAVCNVLCHILQLIAVCLTSPSRRYWVVIHLWVSTVVLQYSVKMISRNKRGKCTFQLLQHSHNKA